MRHDWNLLVSSLSVERWLCSDWKADASWLNAKTSFGDSSQFPSDFETWWLHSVTSNFIYLMMTFLTWWWLVVTSNTPKLIMQISKHMGPKHLGTISCMGLFGKFLWLILPRTHHLLPDLLELKVAESILITQSY